MLSRAGFAGVTPYASVATHASNIREMGPDAAMGIERDASGEIIRYHNKVEATYV